MKLEADLVGRDPQVASPVMILDNELAMMAQKPNRELTCSLSLTLPGNP